MTPIALRIATRQTCLAAVLAVTVASLADHPILTAAFTLIAVLNALLAIRLRQDTHRAQHVADLIEQNRQELSDTLNRPGQSRQAHPSHRWN